MFMTNLHFIYRIYWCINQYFKLFKMGQKSKFDLYNKLTYTLSLIINLVDLYTEPKFIFIINFN